MSRVLCRLLPACVAQPRGCGLRRDPHSLPPAPLEPSLCCWDVLCSGGTGEVEERVVLNGHKTRVLSGVLALHQAQRGFSSGWGTAGTGASSVQSRELQCPHHGPRELVLELDLPSWIPELQGWEGEGSTQLCLSLVRGAPRVSWGHCQVNVPTAHWLRHFPLPKARSARCAAGGRRPP